MLIKKGANLFIRDELGRIPLHYVFTKVPTGLVELSENRFLDCVLAGHFKMCENVLHASGLRHA